MEILPSAVFQHLPGDDYYVVSPQLPGYLVDIEIVEGVITEDMHVYVHYTREPNQLIIHYLLPDGTEAAADYTATLLTGEPYNVHSPEIPGYTAVRLRIAGTNPGRDEQYTVLYVPEDGSTTVTTLEDYETPTHLEATYIQMGICLE